MVFMAFMPSNEPTCVPPTRYLGPRSPKIGPRKGQNPQVWPILAYFGLFGPKDLEKGSTCFKVVPIRVQAIRDPQKPCESASAGPITPRLARDMANLRNRGPGWPAGAGAQPGPAAAQDGPKS